MFTYDEVSHFRTFGHVTLRGLLDQAETRALTDEVTTELTAAFGGLGTDDDPDHTGGIRGDYLPLTVDRAPLSQALMADDPRLCHGAAELLGTPVVPTPPIATCFTANADWHTDHGPALGGLKFLAHLAPRTAADGALRVIPGSHEPGFAARLHAYRSTGPAAQGFPASPVPHVVVPTEPGDVIAFDAHLLHSSAGGRRRLAWTVEYLPWPGLADPERLRVTREFAAESAEYGDRYDTRRWPAWQEWAAGAPGVPSRLLAVQRLRLLGVIG
ncbi:MAG TPA: phytanoyl-CoA dioxygenase family protein [Pseudonocardiaceae bacterium]|nr:phytanoyl-CoA dioxygenase family protein [Pseudonocardiaceae bacterium]